MTREEQIKSDIRGLAETAKREEEQALLYAFSLLQGFLLDVARIADALTEKNPNG